MYWLRSLRLPTAAVLVVVLGATGIGLLRTRADVVVNTNVSSLEAQRQLNATQSRLQESFQRLSSGFRTNSAADDAAGLAVSEKMRASVRSLGQASRNAQNGISLLQTADGAYAEIANILVRMRELAVQSANGTLTESNREQIHTEYEQLVSEISRLTGVGLVYEGTNYRLQIQGRTRGAERSKFTRTSSRAVKQTKKKGKAAKRVDIAPEISAAQGIFRQNLTDIGTEVRHRSIDDIDDVVAALLEEAERSRSQMIAQMRQLLDALELQDQKAQELIRQMEAIQSENARWNESFASVTSSATSSSTSSSSSSSSSSPLPSSSSSEVSKGHEKREMLPRSEKEQSSAAAFSSAKSVYSK